MTYHENPAPRAKLALELKHPDGKALSRTVIMRTVAQALHLEGDRERLLVSLWESLERIRAAVVAARDKTLNVVPMPESLPLGAEKLIVAAMSHGIRPGPLPREGADWSIDGALKIVADARKRPDAVSRALVVVFQEWFRLRTWAWTVLEGADPDEGYCRARLLYLRALLTDALNGADAAVGARA